MTTPKESRSVHTEEEVQSQTTVAIMENTGGVQPRLQDAHRYGKEKEKEGEETQTKGRHIPKSIQIYHKDNIRTMAWQKYWET